MRARLLLIPLLVPLVVLPLAACSPAGDDELTLVETKSPVQLLRNEAWYRLPDFIVKESSETTDVSIACSDDGMERSWTSSTIALVNNSFAPRTAAVAEDVIASFVSQGWAAAVGDAAEGEETVLTKEGSIATIAIHAVPKSDEHRASIAITTTGPCVTTAGEDSDEVKVLEGRT